jgi:phage-related protein
LNGIQRLEIIVRSLDDNTKREIGTLLMLLQSGKRLGEPQSKPMNSIHKNAHELRVKDKKGAHRIIYVLNLNEKIFILHAFTKKTQKTPIKEIELSRKRLQDYLNENK